jgi:hypothetical protein
MTGIKRSKITVANEFTPILTTPMGRLGCKSKDIIIEEILRLYYVCKE